MNRFIFYSVFLLLCSCMSIKAQTYVIKNLKGKAEIRRNVGGQPERVHNMQEVFGSYLLTVEQSLDLHRGEKHVPISVIIDPITINDAWKNAKIINQIGTDATPMGNEHDSIGFCFITTEEEWRTDNMINNNDQFSAMVINHNSLDTLYAYVYWVFPKSGLRIPLYNAVNGKTCVLLPNTYNRIDFEEKQNTPEEDNSTIYIFFSREAKKAPKGRFQFFDSFYEEMESRKFSITHFEIGINSRR